MKYYWNIWRQFKWTYFGNYALDKSQNPWSEFGKNNLNDAIWQMPIPAFKISNYTLCGKTFPFVFLKKSSKSISLIMNFLIAIEGTFLIWGVWGGGAQKGWGLANFVRHLRIKEKPFTLAPKSILITSD